MGACSCLRKSAAGHRDQALNIDALSQALDPAPMIRAEAVAVLDRFPWAVPTSTISNFISGRRVEVDLGDLSEP
jgi:hypothetical protein